MNAKVENLGNSKVKITIEVDAAQFEAACEKVYFKQRGKIQLPGFRKGKAPRKMIEKAYGPGVFFEDAANDLIPVAYDEALDTTKVDVVARPEIDVIQLEKGMPFIFTAEVAVKPEITLGQYKGVEVTKEAIEISDDEISEELTKVQEQNSREVNITDRVAALGDTVIIDFEGFVDGVAFDGGKAEEHSLVLGSHSFIDTFEDQIVGKNIGDKFDVTVTFPAEYQEPSLAGQPALFEVTLHAIQTKELPVLDDDFAKDVSEFDTLDEYKASLKAIVAEKKEKEAEGKVQDEILAKIVETSTFVLPDEMVEFQAENMANEFANSLKYQGIDINQYFQYTQSNMKALVTTMLPEAKKRVERSLILEAIAKAEGFEVTAEELTAELTQIATMYRVELAEIEKTMTEDYKEKVMDDVKLKKALDFVTAAAVIA